jgi:predicted transcriptional regulator
MNYRFDRNKFERLLSSKQITAHEMADKLGLKYDSLYRKMVNINRFNIREIIIILDTLEMTFEEVFKDNEW